MKTLRVSYKCRCIAAEAEIEVPARVEDADLSLWMEVLRGMIALDHRRRSPNCLADTMEYAKIPLEEGAPGIGVAPQVN